MERKTGKFCNNLINGKWVPSTSGDTYRITNPAQIDDVVGEAQASTENDALSAIEAASNALDEWANTPAPVRAKILFKTLNLIDLNAEMLAQSITMEEGKPINDAIGEVRRSMDVLQYSAGEGRRMFGYTTPSEVQNTLAYTERRPLGVVSIITPWNFPLAIPAWKIAPALICGNTVVFKPASTTPITAIKLVELFQEAGLPDGVLNLVTGSGTSVGNVFVDSDEVKGISFTGSTEIGSQIYAKGAHGLKKVQCEMGGKNAVILLADADVDKAMIGIVQGAFGSTGQRCTATSRLIIESPLYETFVEKLIQHTSTLKIGPGIDSAVDVGPLASKAQLDTVMRYIEIGVTENATLAYGGNQLGGSVFDDGYYVEPTIFTDVASAMTIAQEEIFGPVLTVFEARNLADAIELSNNVAFGLSSSIYTNNLTRAFEYVKQIESGMVHVNSPTLGGEVHLPFGGLKSSGVGHREQGVEAIEFFSELVTVYIDYGDTP